MSSTEWSRYMHDELGVPMEPDEISAAVVEGLEARYRRQVPLLPRAVETVRALAGRWPLAVASSANRPLIDLVLELTGHRRALPAQRSRPRRCRGESPSRTSTSRPRGGWKPLRSVRRGRGLHQRDPLGERRRDARDRGAAAGLPAVGRGAELADVVVDSLAELRGGAGRADLKTGQPGDGSVWLRRRAPARARPRDGASASRRSRAWPRRRPEQDQGRDREDFEARRGLLVLVRVDADDGEILALGRHLLEDRVNDAAGTAPGAQKSTSTGCSDSSTSDWKLPSVTSGSFPVTSVLLIARSASSLAGGPVRPSHYYTKDSGCRGKAAPAGAKDMRIGSRRSPGSRRQRRGAPPRRVQRGFAARLLGNRFGACETPRSPTRWPSWPRCTSSTGRSGTGSSPIARRRG